MALTADTFLQPKGPIDPQLFAREERRDVLARIAQYINNAEADARITAIASGAQHDAAVDAFVRWQAFRDAYILLVAKPANVGVTEKGSSAYLMDQINALKLLADEALQELDAVINSGALDLFAPESMSTKTDVTWWAGRTTL